MTAVRRPYVWLILCLIVQAALLTHRLDLLPMWGDELFTLRAAQQPIGTMLETVRGDVHPPLYFLLAHYWIQMAPSGDALPWLRLLSVLFTLLSTIALDRLWLKHAPPSVRSWCLALWTFSACLLLYSRMARSYSLQVLGFVVVCWAAWRWSQELSSWKRLLLWAGSLAALLYTHYVPGNAAWAGANVLLLTNARRPPWRLLAGNLIVLAAYLPWVVTLASVLAVWRAKPGLLLITSNSLFESSVKSAYWFFSFSYGEAIPVWMLPVTALLAIPVLWLLWTGARAGRTWVVPAAVTALIGFAGVAGWVSYAFGPARLLFLLPLALLAIAAGAHYAPRAGTVIAGALLAANLVGIASYFQARDLLNIGYLAPMDRIARDIAGSSSPADTIVLIDGPNLSGVVLEYYLAGFSTRQIFTPQDAEAARRELANPAIRHVWLMRNPRDVTPGNILERMGTELRGSYQGRLHPYVSFSPTHKALMRAAGVQVSSDWMYAAWEFRKP
ncbi:MAG: rane protein-like protein [Bryobacterales bacterium]|nr:rane protein-like protein [Bryobacterales bacterium]